MIGCKVPLIKLDLPLPETPVIQMNFPRGNSTVTFFRLFPVAPDNIIFFPFPVLLWGANSISSLPVRYRAVRVSVFNISFGVPAKTTSPPRRPALGPYNIIGFEHHFLIVLHYNNRIPHIP